MSLGVGVVGIDTVVVGVPLVSVAVTRTPLVIVVLPVLVAPAVHVLLIASAVNWPLEMQEVWVPGHVPDGWVVGWTDAVDVTCPPASVPSVLTDTGPELKRVAGPKTTVSEASVAVSGVAEPPDGSVTDGLGPNAGWAPPKRVMLGAETPNALPFTALTAKAGATGTVAASRAGPMESGLARVPMPSSVSPPAASMAPPSRSPGFLRTARMISDQPDAFRALRPRIRRIVPFPD